MADSDVGAITPYDLITDELVSKALKVDEGPEAVLSSWEVKDFTNLGDNYSSFVTSVMVKYVKQGEKLEKSFVTKLNPLRPPSASTDFAEKTYGREIMMLSEVIVGMNQELEALGLPEIKTPKIFSYNLTTGRQMFVAEDLRKQGFKMFDRTKAMDIPHALLIVEELGRFHASGLLFENTLPNKSIPDTFDYFEPYWKNENSVFDMLNSMVTQQCKSACDLLSSNTKYKSCSEWVNNKMDSLAKIFVDSMRPSGSFDLLTHGDCWTNNMLFKYDSEGNPVDLRLVDVQIARKSSPACDLNYFFYSSLDCRTVQENYKLLKVTYYLSFLRVFLLANREPPFTFREFEGEMDKRKLFGVFAGMLLLPIVLAKEGEFFDPADITEDTMEDFLKEQKERLAKMAEKEGPFRDRFLAIFDEVIEKRIFVI